MQTLRDAAADVLLGGRCVGCEQPGRVLCDGCAERLPVAVDRRWPASPPPGLVPPYSATTYAGLARTLVVAHKERGITGLRPVLGDLLALAVATALVESGVGPRHPVVLVPVPSRAASVRSRGADPTHAITLRAAAVLRAAGTPTDVVRLLRLRPGVVDQAGLDRAQRHDNLAGSMACSTRLLRRHSGRAVRVVVCDDVLTSGSTAREAQRALEAVGVSVLALACVAATPLRSPGTTGATGPPGHRESCAPVLSSPPEGV